MGRISIFILLALAVSSGVCSADTITRQTKIGYPPTWQCDLGSNVATIALDSPVGAGNTILLFVSAYAWDQLSLTITDTQGNSYSPVNASWSPEGYGLVTYAAFGANGGSTTITITASTPRITPTTGIIV